MESTKVSPGAGGGQVSSLNVVNVKGDRGKGQRRWTQTETTNILHYLQETVQGGGQIEKPTADQYYGKLLQRFKFENCSVGQLKHKSMNLKRQYIKTVQWRGQTGQGVLEAEGQDSFEKTTLKQCPHFHILDEIFGTRASIHPPSLIEIDPPEDIEQAEIPPSGTQNESEDVGQDLIEKQSESPNIRKGLKRVRQKEVGGLKALAECQEKKTLLDNRKLEVETLRFEFEKEKWNFEKEMEERRLRLEESKVQNSLELSRYEIEMKYKTQLEMAKLAKETK